MKTLASPLLLAAGLTVAPAAILLNEDFAYPNGPLTTNSGGLWATHSGTAGQLDVTNGAAFLTASDSEDVNRQLAGQPYPAAGATNVFYAGFTVRFLALPSDAGAYFAHFFSSATVFRGRVWALGGGAPTGQFRLGLSSVANTVTATNTMENLALNTSYRLVLRVENTNNCLARLWINPTTESDPALTTSGESAGPATFTAFALRQNSGMGTLLLDDLVVATSFQEALTGASPPQPPVILLQPVSQVVTQGSNVTLTVIAEGTPPLAYQWWFDDAPLSGATNSSLTLNSTTPEQAGFYTVTITNAHGAVTSEPAELTVFIPPPPPPPPVPLTPVFSVLTYNTAGNGDPNWTTNNSQVRALGRVLAHLQPDVVTFQEIPMTNAGWANMPSIIATYLPGYFLATNSGHDGFIRAAIASRHPILRSQSWLWKTNLSAFGTNIAFTRDLFEAEIAVPDFDEPVHVFTAHLKSGTTSTADAIRRAAEAAAISNFFVTNFRPAYSNRLYILTGDLNEDIARPATGSRQPIQRLVNDATGLRLTTPTNPVTGSELTFSIRNTNGLSRRYDYVLPCDLLFSNLASNLVFRSDLLTPLPPGLFSNDVRTASDHLPVMIWFANPYPRPFRLLSLETAGPDVILRWETMSNRLYTVEVSTNLLGWQPLATNLLAVSTNLSFTTPGAQPARFFRVVRQP